MRNSRSWDVGCGSQTPVYPNVAGNHKEFENWAYGPVMSPGWGGIWLSSEVVPGVWRGFFGRLRCGS